jgi:Flp pilus assembly protein CpaB
LPLGVTITVDALRVVSRPASTVPRDVEHDARVLVGRVVLVPRVQDDVIRASNLAPVTRTGLDGVVPAGRRAVHVVVKDGFRPPAGAVVDVLAAFDPSVGAAARTVARGALVLAVDDASGSGAGAGSAVTLLVSEREALDVAYADANGAVTVVLAPPETACCPSG